MNDAPPAAAARATCPTCGTSLAADAPEGLCPRCLGRLPLTPVTSFEDEAEIPAAAISIEGLAPHFPQLEILKFLGRGGMGVVYQARQKSLHRLVALKLIVPERAGDAAFARRFTREALALAALNHPHIVTVYDFGEAGGYYYLLMEFVDGVTLRQAAAAGRFTPEQALAVVPPVCAALQYAHEHGIVHRDIKPENLLIDRVGRIKIADFGIARMLGETAEADSLRAGTPQYMAPEQQGHGTTDHRADIYALGVILYEMLTGELPRAPLGSEAAPLRQLHIDTRLEEIVLRALEHSPEMRFQTAVELQTQLECYATGVPVSAPQPRAPARFSRVAIAGSAWAAACFVIVPPFLWHEVSTHEFEREGPFATPLVSLVFFVFILPAFTAPFGTTVLGWIACTQLRRAEGRLYGHGLAAFDALLFPLLALDALISGLLFFTFKLAIPGWGLESRSFAVFVVASLALSSWADRALIRRHWSWLQTPAPPNEQDPV